jgi:hypothetical protein
MKPFSLNLSKMKKVSSDKHSSTFEHPSGHKIIIAHSKLPAIHREQISKMPMHGGGMPHGADMPKHYDDGGAIEKDQYGLPKEEPKSASQSQSGDSKKTLGQTIGYPGMAEGGVNENPKTDPSTSPLPPGASEIYGPPAAPGTDPTFQNGPQQPKSYLDSFATGQIPALSQTTGQGAAAPAVEIAKSAPSASGSMIPAAAASDEKDLPTASTDLPGYGQSIGQDQGQPPASSVSSGVGPNGVSLKSAYNLGTQGINKEAEAERLQSSLRIQAEQQYQQDIQNEQKSWDDRSQSMQSDIQHTIDDIKSGQINPNHYMENRSTPQKIAGIIGMIIGGAGAGAGRPNPAVQMMQYQIDKDIDAQKTNLASQNNILAGYQDKYKNAASAEAMTRATLMGHYASQLQSAADTAADPMSRARALAAKSQLQQQMIPLINNANLMQSAQKFQSGNGPSGQVGSEGEFHAMLAAAQAINPTFYKDQSEKYVPGVGVAAKPIAQQDQERIANFHALSPLIDKAIADQQKFGMTGAWTPKDRADAASDRNALTVQLNKLTGLNRLNDREYQNYGQQVGNIGGVNAGGTLETLQNLKQQTETDKSSFMQSYGITPFRGSAAQHAAAQSAPKVGQVLYSKQLGHYIQITDKNGTYRAVKAPV